MHEIYVRIPAKQLLILQPRIALIECLGSKFDESGANIAVARPILGNPSTIHANFAASGVELIAQVNVSCAC